MLHHEDDLNWPGLIKHDSARLIAHEDYIPVLLKKNILSFYDHPYAADTPEKDIGYFIQNWHRDENGIDLSYAGGISIAQILSVGFWHTLVGLYRDYYSIKYCAEKYNRLFISCNESEEFIGIAKLFGDKVSFFTPDHNSRPLIQSRSFERILGAFPRVDWRTRLLGSVQYPLRSLVKQKNLFFKDWGNKHLVRRQPDSIVIDAYQPWKGAYLREPSSTDLKASGKLVPESINVKYDPAWLHTVLSRNNIQWDKDFLEIISSSLRERYRKYRDYFIRVIAIYQDLLSVYRPRNLILPGMTHEAYTIVAQLARSMNIPTYLAVDGYHVTTGGYNYLYDNSGKDLLFSRIVVYGRQHYDLLVESGINKEKLCILRPPLMDNHACLPQSSVRYDAIVMTTVPHARCPTGYLSSRLRVLQDTLEAVSEAGHKKVAVKIKAGVEKEIFIDFLSRSGWLNKVDVLEGMFYTHIRKANRIIGGISTAVGEAAFHDIPYYVYEPVCNGYQDYELKSSKVVAFDRIARTKQQLVELLDNPHGSIHADREYLFDGDGTLPLG